MSIRMFFYQLVAVLIVFPSFAYAAGASTADSGTLVTIAEAFNKSIVNSLITLAIAIAMATFFYGGFRYVWGIRNGEEAALKEGNKFLLWGGVTLFVMVSMYGIIAVLQGTVGFSSATIKIPNASLNFIGSGSGSGNGAGGARQTITGAAASPKQAATSGGGAPKAKDAGGVCEPDADGTTYRPDPNNSASCLPDSSCQPGYKEDPNDKESCIQMSNDEACPPEDGVTFTLQSNGMCEPTNGGCPLGETANANDECVAPTGNENGGYDNTPTEDPSASDAGNGSDYGGYDNTPTQDPSASDGADYGGYDNTPTSDGGDVSGLPVDEN